MSSFLLLIISYAIIGTIENRGDRNETWKANEAKSRKGKFLITFVKWGRIISVTLGIVLIMYLFAPTSFTLFLFLLAGIVIRNIIEYFTDNNSHEKLGN